MKLHAFPCATGVLLLACIGIACAGVQARSDFDPHARFDAYRTFAWIGDEPGTLGSGSGGEGADPLLARRIREAIEAQLASRGYRKVEDPAEADFVVSFDMGKQEKLRIQSTPTPGPAYGYGGWYTDSGVSTTSYTEGTLNVDVFDGRSHQAVWHGWATTRINPNADRAALVDEVVGAILAKFPPPR